MKPPAALVKLVPPEPPKQTGHDVLSADFRPMALEFEARCAARGVPVRRIETRRTEPRQGWLFGKGRKFPNLDSWPFPEGLPLGRTVTKADGVVKRSNHQDGDACDYWPVVDGKVYCPPLYLNAKQRILHPAWQALRDVCLELNLRWGGAWGDGPHVERPVRKQAYNFRAPR